jgi:hypothetical protein
MTIGSDRDYADRAALRDLRATLARRAPGVVVHLSRNAPTSDEPLTTVVIHLIHVPVTQRGYGLGQRVLDAVCEAADENRWRLTLTPVSDFGSDLTRLTSWYLRSGFTPSSGGRHDLARAPLAAAA